MWTIKRAILATVMCSLAACAGVEPANPPPAGGLWAHDNLLAWCVVPFDAVKPSPEVSV
jgi:hypothetical protein